MVPRPLIPHRTAALALGLALFITPFLPAQVPAGQAVVRGALASADNRPVTDALRELPDLVVELDGTIRIRGNTPTIYINGRPAPMEGVSLAVFLEQFPADRIERIEVLDSPSARFSAEGAGGIINIVLKEGVELGLSGSLLAASETGSSQKPAAPVSRTA